MKTQLGGVVVNDQGEILPYTVQSTMSQTEELAIQLWGIETWNKLQELGAKVVQCEIVVKEISKPQKNKKEYFNIYEIFNYVNEKYKIGLDFNKFWSFLVLEYELSNGKTFYIIPEEALTSKLEYEMVNLMECLQKEFGDEIEVLAEW